jgi:type II secretion system protein G
MARWERMLLIVVVGFGLVVFVASVLVPSGGGRSRPVNKREVAGWIFGDFRDGLERFRADVGRYPTQAEGLGALLKNPGEFRWRGPYWKPVAQFGDGEIVLPRDPWGREYRYVVSGGRGRAYIISSDGPDGVAGDGG